MTRFIINMFKSWYESVNKKCKNVWGAVLEQQNIYYYCLTDGFEMLQLVLFAHMMYV